MTDTTLNEAFGLEEVTGNPADRYKFRTSPLRNVAVQPTFMHNASFHAFGRCDSPPLECNGFGIELHACQSKSARRPERHTGANGQTVLVFEYP